MKYKSLYNKKTLLIHIFNKIDNDYKLKLCLQKIK